MFQKIMRGGLSFAVAALLALPASISAQQVGQITGTVTHAETGDPLSAVQVSVQGTQLGAITNAQGTYTVQNVPVGTRTVNFQRLGFQQVRRDDVTVSAGETTTLNVELAPAVLALQEIVATGLVDPVEGVRSPITVGRVSRDQMPVVSSGSAVQNLQGRIPGMIVNRRSGEPGEDVNIMLRSPTSVIMQGEPMIVVDGVILGSGTTNIEGMDIESIEVIKGAAAASLYGSRAAAGVIAIQTSRGQGLEEGQTSFTARSEFGRNQTVRTVGFPQHHHFLVDDEENPTTYVDFDGNPVDRANRVAPADANQAFMDKPYPGPIFDNVGAMLGNPGTFQSHNFSIQQNTASTNFAISANRRVEEGVLRNNDGFELNSFRVNLDHRFLETMSVGISAYHSRDWRDEVEASFVQLLQAPVDVDMLARDEDGQFVRIPDPAFPFENPIWREASRENERWRARTLASANLRWEPTYWLSLMGNMSYDRQDTRTRNYTPKGTPTGLQDATSGGAISYNTGLSDTWNAEAQVSLRRDFGALNARTTFRGLLERDQNESANASGSDFFVGGVPRINAAETRNASSFTSEVRALGYLWDTAFDYDGKYIGTVLVRYDGSSLFGPDNRWHAYYRTAFKWRLSEEDWFNLPNVNEFGLSYARGTAGGRPGFSAQYETWSVGAGGVSKGTLGNRNLRPEHTTEQEVSLEMILFERYGVELVHSWQTTTDQLVNARAPAFTGFSSQWQNGGTVTGHTTELSVEAQVIQTPTFAWNAGFVADRTRGEITEWPFACENPSYRMRCEGVGIYDIWGFRFLDSHDDLVAHDGGSAAGASDEFVINDDGYLVWVGAGNSYTDMLWGQSTTIGGQTYNWGIPILDRLDTGALHRQRTGDSSHINLGLLNNLRFGNLSFHSHLHASVGGDAVNRSWQEMIASFRYPGMDQAGKPEELKKPISYYDALLAQNAGSTHFQEDGSYLKLRTFSVNYRMDQEQLGRFGLGNVGINSMSLGLVGRNLFTLTNYRGFDPEQALNVGNRQNMDRFNYPNTRNFTAEIQVTF